MTNMIHKSREQKRERRNRYVAVVDLFRKRFQCTAKQAFGVCTDIVRENGDLKKEVAKLGCDIVRAKEENKLLQSKLDATSATPE